jgi:hypothetical protein
MHNPAGKHHFGKDHRQNVRESKLGMIKTNHVKELPKLEDYNKEFVKDNIADELSGMFGAQICDFHVIETTPWEQEAAGAIESWQVLSKNQKWRESEKGILPILEAINSIPGVVTTDCCSGHWDPYGVCYVGFLSDTKEKGYKVLTGLVEYFGLENVYKVTFRPGIAEVVESNEYPGNIILKGRLGFYIQFLPEGFYSKVKSPELSGISKLLI